MKKAYTFSPQLCFFLMYTEQFYSDKRNEHPLVWLTIHVNTMDKEKIIFFSLPFVFFEIFTTQFYSDMR